MTITSEDKPWWRPEETTPEWCQQTRDEEGVTGTDEDIREEYADGDKYATTWDHMGDVREALEPLMDHLAAVEADRDALAEGVRELVRGWLRYAKMPVTEGLSPVSHAECWALRDQSASCADELTALLARVVEGESVPEQGEG